MRSWRSLFAGYGYKPYFVEGSDPAQMHQKMAETLERAIDEIRAHSEEGTAIERCRPARAGR